MNESARSNPIPIVARAWTSVDAVDQFVERYRDSSFRIALRIVGRRDLAEDVAQDALIRAFKSWDRLALIEHQAAWVRKTVVRCAISALEREPKSESLEENQTGEAANATDVESTLASLSSEHRAILALSLGEGWSYQEISEMLGIPIGTVGSRIYAAKAAFRQAWEEER